MIKLVDLVTELAMVCDECGQAGRRKGALDVGGVIGYYCHDEEKSCYFYRSWQMDQLG